MIQRTRLACRLSKPQNCLGLGRGSHLGQRTSIRANRPDTCSQSTRPSKFSSKLLHPRGRPHMHGKEREHDLEPGDSGLTSCASYARASLVWRADGRRSSRTRPAALPITASGSSPSSRAFSSLSMRHVPGPLGHPWHHQSEYSRSTGRQACISRTGNGQSAFVLGRVENSHADLIECVAEIFKADAAAFRKLAERTVFAILPAGIAEILVKHDYRAWADASL